MKTYKITFTKTVNASNEIEARENAIYDIKNSESTGLMFDEVKEIKYRYITFQELLDMYAAPKSVIDSIEPIVVYNKEDKVITGFQVNFKGYPNQVLFNDVFGTEAPADTLDLITREVVE